MLYDNLVSGYYFVTILVGIRVNQLASDLICGIVALQRKPSTEIYEFLSMDEERNY